MLLINLAEFVILLVILIIIKYTKNNFCINEKFSRGKTKNVNTKNCSIGSDNVNMENSSYVQCFGNFFGLIITTTVNVNYKLRRKYFHSYMLKQNKKNIKSTLYFNSKVYYFQNISPKLLRNVERM